MRLLELISPNGVLSTVNPRDFTHKGESSDDEDGEYFDSDFEDTAPYTPADTSIDKFMKQYGFKKLGAGAYASVFERSDRNYVIKIFTDKSYLKFYELTKKYPNPCFPKFYTQPRIIPTFKRNHGADIYFVKMEKLYPLHNIDDELKTWIDYFRMMRAGHTIEFDVKSKQFVGHTTKSMLERLNKLPRNQFMKACLTVQGILVTKLGLESDFSESNCMMRQSGELVITDPVQEAYVS